MDKSTELKRVESTRIKNNIQNTFISVPIVYAFF